MSRSHLVVDPTRPSVVFIVDPANPIDGLGDLDPVLVNVHSATNCHSHKVCMVHNPSAHHMRSWPLNWRNDAGFMERICLHGIGHPDPDGVAYRKSIGISVVHGCDGCCQPDEENEDA